MNETTTQNRYPLEEVLEKFSTEQVKIIKGGSVLDYVCAYLKSAGEDHNAPDAERWLNNMMTGEIKPKMSAASKRNSYLLMQAEPLEDLALLRYLEKLHIPTGLAQQLLDEVYIRDLDNNRKFYALGLRNEDNGYAFANPLVHGFAGGQTVSFVRNKMGRKAATINLYADWLDMLSAFTRFPEVYREQDSLCLNGLGNLSHAFGYITGYGYRFLCSWMTNDAQGQQAGEVLRRYANTQQGLTHKRMNSLYLPHPAFSQWHMKTLHDS